MRRFILMAAVLGPMATTAMAAPTIVFFRNQSDEAVHVWNEQSPASVLPASATVVEPGEYFDLKRRWQPAIAFKISSDGNDFAKIVAIDPALPSERMVAVFDGENIRLSEGNEPDEAEVEAQRRRGEERYRAQCARTQQAVAKMLLKEKQQRDLKKARRENPRRKR